jgi:hypothetical protein
MWPAARRRRAQECGTCVGKGRVRRSCAAIVRRGDAYPATTPHKARLGESTPQALQRASEHPRLGLGLGPHVFCDALPNSISPGCASSKPPPCATASTVVASNAQTAERHVVDCDLNKTHGSTARLRSAPPGRVFFVKQARQGPSPEGRGLLERVQHTTDRGAERRRDAWRAEQSLRLQSTDGCLSCRVCDQHRCVLKPPTGRCFSHKVLRQTCGHARREEHAPVFVVGEERELPLRERDPEEPDAERRHQARRPAACPGAQPRAGRAGAAGPGAHLCWRVNHEPTHAPMWTSGPSGPTKRPDETEAIEPITCVGLALPQL